MSNDKMSGQRADIFAKEWEDILSCLNSMTSQQRADALVKAFIALEDPDEDIVLSIKRWLREPANREEKIRAVKGCQVLEDILYEIMFNEQFDELWTDMFGASEDLCDAIMHVDTDRDLGGKALL